MIAVLVAIGCSGDEPSPDPLDEGLADADTDADSDTDTDADTDTDTQVATGDTSAPTDTGPLVLNGDIPAVALPPPVFTARNMDGTDRTQPDLIGHPTVMWFYPAAGTAG